MNGEAIAIDQATFHQVLCAIDAVIDINNAPLSIEPLAILPAIASATTIIYIQQGKAPASPELPVQTEGAGDGTCWATVAFDNQWRKLSGGRDIIGVVRRVEESMGSESIFRWKLYRLRN